MSTVKEEFERVNRIQSQALIDRFQKLVDETAKAIEDEINSNIVSRQRAIET